MVSCKGSTIESPDFMTLYRQLNALIKWSTKTLYNLIFCRLRSNSCWNFMLKMLILSNIALQGLKSKSDDFTNRFNCTFLENAILTKIALNAFIPSLTYVERAMARCYVFWFSILQPTIIGNLIFRSEVAFPSSTGLPKCCLKQREPASCPDFECKSTSNYYVKIVLQRICNNKFSLKLSMF